MGLSGGEYKKGDIMPKNVLHVIQGGKGGTLEYLKLFLSFMDKSKYNFTIICHGEIYDELTKLGYKTYKVEMKRSISLIDDFKSFIGIYKYIRNHKVDLVHAHSSKAGVLARLAAKINNIPCIYNSHGWAFNLDTSKFKKNIYGLFERIASKWCDAIVVISQSECNAALERKICKSEKLIIINNGIDLTKYNIKKDYNFKTQLGFQRDEILIGMCGRITKQKSPITFVKVAKKILDMGFNYKFLLIGDGELKNDVIKEINMLGLKDNFIITGWVDNPEKFINILDIGVLTSKGEGFGLVLAEYMACGRPIVASKVQGVVDVVRNEIDGFLCDSNDIDMFASYIVELINISKNQIQRVREEFGFERVAKEHEILYDKLLISRDKQYLQKLKNQFRDSSI